MIFKDVWVLTGNRFSDSWCLAFDEEYRDYKTGEEITFINVNGAPIPVKSTGEFSESAPEDLKTEGRPSGLRHGGRDVLAFPLAPEKNFKLNEIVYSCARKFTDVGVKSFVKEFDRGKKGRLSQNVKKMFAIEVVKAFFDKYFMDETNGTINSVGEVRLSNGEYAIFTKKSKYKFIYAVSKNPKNIYILPYLVRVLSKGTVKDDPKHHARDDNIRGFYEVSEVIDIPKIGRYKVYVNVGRTKNYNLVYNFGVNKSVSE